MAVQYGLAYETGQLFPQGRRRGMSFLGSCVDLGLFRFFYCTNQTTALLGSQQRRAKQMASDDTYYPKQYGAGGPDRPSDTTEPPKAGSTDTTAPPKPKAVRPIDPAATFLTVEEACRIGRFGKTKFYEFRKTLGLPSVKPDGFGGRRIPREPFQRWLEEVLWAEGDA